MDQHTIAENPFTPSFGEIPYSLAGRRDETRRIDHAFGRQGRDPYLSTLITGARGTGKTALLRYAAQTAESRGWLSVSTFAVEGMLESIYESACDRAAHLVDTEVQPRITSVTAGPVSISWEHPAGTQLTWNTKMRRLLEQLTQSGTGLLILVDEIRADLDELISLVSAYQIFAGEGLRIALYLAGLPRETSRLINHESVSFLRRAMQFRLGSIADYDAEFALEKTIHAGGKSIAPDALSYAARATAGFPFMIQLVGYRIWEWAEESDAIGMGEAQKGSAYAQREFDDRILAPSFYEMSSGDRAFAKAMLQDEEYSTVADIGNRLGRGSSYAAQYKRRLLEQGVIEENYDKSVRFALPGMREFVAAHA